MRSRQVHGSQHRWASLGQQRRCLWSRAGSGNQESACPQHDMWCLQALTRNSAVPCMLRTLPHMTSAAAVRAQHSWQLSDTWDVLSCRAALLGHACVLLAASPLHRGLTCDLEEGGLR